jgi:nucleoside-diphosphate-sugar epimerase
MAGPRVLLTGATGFLGSHVLAALQARRVEAWALSRRPPTDIPPKRWVALHNVADLEAMRQAIASAAPDVILHAAGAAVGSLDTIYAANAVFGATLLAAAADAAPRARMVLAGSAAECGFVPPECLPVTEETAPRPRDAYGISKLAQTFHALAALERGQSVVVARLFNFIGPGMPAHLALGSFGRQLAAMQPSGGALKTGNLSGERDLLPVDEVVDSLLALAEHPDAVGVVNICSGQPLLMRDVVAEMLRHCPFPVTLQEEPERFGVTSVKRHFGSPAKLHALGIHTAAPDLAAMMKKFMAAFLRQGSVVL